MFTLSVVLGSSILYRDFQSAHPPRILKFTFGYLETFIGVYLITSKRSVTCPPALSTGGTVARTSPEPMSVGISTPSRRRGRRKSSLLAETPPHLLGTSLSYHF